MGLENIPSHLIGGGVFVCLPDMKFSPLISRTKCVRGSGLARFLTLGEFYLPVKSGRRGGRW